MTAPPLLAIKNLTAHYGAAQALFGIDLEIERAETVALVGANGAGKTTLLKCIMGLLPASGGEIRLDERLVRGASPARMVRYGRKKEMASRIQGIFQRFGRLAERRDQPAGTLSGGEQQMLAMGRALMARPRLLLLDEPSLGLAPRITDEIFAIIHQLARSGVTILLVEQNAARALSASTKAFLMSGGKIVEQGRSSDLLVDPRLRTAFLGAASEEKPEASRLGAAGLTNIRLEKPPMHQQNFMPDFKNDNELATHQLKGLKWTVKHAFEGSPFYRRRLEEAGVGPESIASLDDLTRLPFTTADDLRAEYPFPLRAVPYEQIVRIHASSGTTGKRKILGYTQKDLDDWVHFFARCYAMAGVTPLDRVQIAVGY
ncbi:MAG: ATP-binding cassette domain-containing protein, partial [Desulfosarcinaceae bacterium]